MVLKCLTVGNMQENCYLFGDPSALLVIDPGDEAERILSYIEENDYNVLHIVLTHCHYDHIGAVYELAEKTGASLILGAHEAENYKNRRVTLAGYFQAMPKLREPERLLQDGETIESGAYAFRVIETPGHTSGSICLLGEDVLFSGDTLFRGSIGRADFPTGDLRTLIQSIRDKLFVLPPETKVYPGHGEMSTIGYEKENNEVYEWERRTIESMGRSV
ncbi:MAG: MBL fold metallo-hydrolase [Clostridia bacterium]|nr:MBL fold metallo-hydrolase [Clostridia bacterium]